MTLDPEVKKKIDAALGRIKEPQSELPITDLGIVRNIRYSEKEMALDISLAVGYPSGYCPACAAINSVVEKTIERLIKEEFGKEFPGFRIIVS
jgi:metal-sulfur cluster biosynthetic enzyme